MKNTKNYTKIKVLASDWLQRAAVILAIAALCASYVASASSIKIQQARNHRLRHGTSSNWSGYAAYGTAGTFNSVSASWQQPSVTCTNQTTYSSYWVGLDGYNTNTVEQLGTEADCSGGQATYYAWYEMYPHWPGNVYMPIHAGDNLKASVTFQGRGYYKLQLSNVTTGRNFSTTQRLNSAQRASAEVIVEAPWSGGTLPLANFGTANFTGAQANGQPLGGFSPLDPITMLNPYGSKATPSDFDSTKQNFSVSYSAN